MRRPPERRFSFRGTGAATVGACSTVEALAAASAIACPRFREAHAATSAVKVAFPEGTCGGRKRASPRLK